MMKAAQQVAVAGTTTPICLSNSTPRWQARQPETRLAYNTAQTKGKHELEHRDVPPSPNFKSEPISSSSDTTINASQKPSNLKFERQDWTLFRTLEGLQQKAGVADTRLRRLVLKELGDNGLDNGTSISIGLLDDNDPDRVFIEDDGAGLGGTPEQIAELFSIRRPMVSTKLLRLPQRGALGNGLRVVAGAVLASEGSLAVITRNQHIELRPQSDGTTAVIKVTKVDHPVGTRIEIGFGAAMPRDPDMFVWARAAKAVASIGKTYEGKSSAHWYDGAQFHELILACGSLPVRSLVAQLDGCTGGKAGEIITAAGLDRMPCERVTREQASKLLTVIQEETRPVSPERLGYVGRTAGKHYAIETGVAKLGSSKPSAVVPFAVECWARKKETGDKVSVGILINRTPTVAEVFAWRDSDKDLCLNGSGLDHYTEEAPKKGGYDVKVNVTTPYCPITSDGKAPNLKPFVEQIMTAIASAMRKAQRAAPKDKKVSQTDIVLANLDEAIVEVGGGYRFGERQLLYWLRPIVRDEIGEELQTGNFKRIITDYEDENDDIPGMYREPRGTIYHPHRRETIPLGTLMVEKYERPVWTFNKLLYIEKEGFSEALKEVGWGERHDCALLSSKGFTTRAARDLVDKLAEHDEDVTVFCATDADAFGGMIYQTFQEATRARGARKIKIIHLGLQPWEAVDADLEVEDVEADSKRRKPVADYVLEREDGEYWEEWLQTHRVELNAMTTPEFIEWLDDKMTEHGVGKLIPPDEVIAEELEQQLEAKVRAHEMERILREAGYEDQVAAALATIERPAPAQLKADIEQLFESDSEHEWRDQIETTVSHLCSPSRGATKF
jgi:hypothetical protein